VDLGSYPPILDAAQVAELLKMNVQMVRKYAREGRIPAYKLPGGRVFHFITQEIIDWLHKHPAARQNAETEDARPRPET